MRGSQSTGSSRTHAFAAATLCVAVLVSLASDVRASYGSASALNPIASPTTPPSGYERGLVTAPNPIDSSSNSVITGEVGGGKHFRAAVPYGSTTSFRASLGSTQLDSFMRYSAVPDEQGGYTPGYELFYSPTGTVSKIPPGRGGVFAPTSPRVAGGIGQWKAERPADVVDLGDLRQSHVSVGETTSGAGDGQDAWRRFGNWPLHETPRELKPAVSDESGWQLPEGRASSQNDRALTPEEYYRQMEQLRQQLEKVKADASKLEQSLRTGEVTPEEASKPAASDPAEAGRSRASIDALMKPQPQVVERSGDSDLLLVKPLPTMPGTPSPERQSSAPDGDIAGVVAPSGLTPLASPKINAPSESRLPISGLQSNRDGPGVDAATRTSRIAELFLPKGQSAAGRTQTGNTGDLPSLRRIKEAAGSLEKPSGLSANAPMSATDSTGSAVDRAGSLAERLNWAPSEMASPAGIDVNTPELDELKPPDRLPGDTAGPKYEALPRSSREKLDRYLKMGQMYLQQGRYYRATESFSLASLYSPNDRRVHLGRSHALFAAGEYVSSAVFLAKAIEMDPDQTLAKFDLVNAVGGPDLFLDRITDLEQCAKASSTPDLQLLLAYIYHEMDRPEEATTAIEAAGKGLPDLAAVDLLKAAIARR
ncbi:MAG: tetratricopeptide repeat protein [Sedimentisphaerales bacterium]|nr:tetratricopeptide repeat protein [Sedimentisphaerales bacterium]